MSAFPNVQAEECVADAASAAMSLPFLRSDCILLLVIQSAEMGDFVSFRFTLSICSKSRAEKRMETAAVQVIRPHQANRVPLHSSGFLGTGRNRLQTRSLVDPCIPVVFCLTGNFRSQAVGQTCSSA